MIPETSNFYLELDAHLSPLGFQRETHMQDSFPIWKSKENSIIIQGIRLAEFKCMDSGKLTGFQQEIVNLRVDGFSAFRIWEDVWNQKKNWILNFLTFRINKPISIFARDTKVVILEENDAQKFADKNHLLGFLKGKTYLACVVPPHRQFRNIQSEFDVDGNPLIAIAVFGKDRVFKSEDGNSQISAELIQICTDSSVRLVGGLTKLISFYANMHQVDNVMTYSDLEWSGGMAFQKIGFTNELMTVPLYFNVVENGKRVLAKDFKSSDACNSGNIKSRLLIHEKK
ncbi:MAG: hypothetical protein HQ448_12000 [Cytophagales bacterium]|nr:hypothetical protein [Cytophagales bacterium]